MLNNGFKKEAISNLEIAHKRYEDRAAQVGKQSAQLMDLRKESSEKLIREVEAYINSLANSPKELNKSFIEYKASFSSFNAIIERLNKDAVTADKQTRAGLTASTSIMNIAPLVVGLGGPVGWAIGGVLLAGTSVFSNKKNKRIGEEAIVKRKEIETFDSALKAALKEIDSLISLTNSHVQGVRQLLGKLLASQSQDYKSFTMLQKEEVGSLVNHINSLSALLNKKVDA